MLRAVKRIAEAAIEAAFKGDFESKIAEARAKVETARAELEQVRSERAETVRQAQVAFDEQPTEDLADALVRAEGKQKLFVGRAEVALRSAEALLAGIEREQDETELASLEKLTDGVNEKVDALMRRHGPTLIDAAMTISAELQLIEATALRHSARAHEIRGKLNRHDPPHPSGIDFGPQRFQALRAAKAKILLDMINDIQGGREHALWLREI